MSDESDLRRRLKSIRDDPTLSPAEKSRLAQQIMMGGKGTDKSVPQGADICMDCSSGPKLVSNCELGCSHYVKECSNFFFECCQVVDPCHRCHMARETCDTKPPAISSIVCNRCGVKQSPSANCSNCSTAFSHSFCSICKIWTAADIFHCEGCGFCRVGKEEEIFHCNNCDACFSKSTQAEHVCAKTKLKGELCPLCLESVHSSMKSSTILNCGHVVHVDCWRSSYQQGNYRCPTCRRSLFDMEPYWEEIRLAIALQPIPAGFFPIRAGDTVISPMGPFLVQSVFEVPAPVADPSCADREDGREDSGGLVTMCKGQLVGWPLAQGRPASATFRRSALRKDDRVTVLCYDCSHRGATPFHFLGLECQGCHGFNTARV